jgi:hypothetical protein
MRKKQINLLILLLSIIILIIVFFLINKNYKNNFERLNLNINKEVSCADCVLLIIGEQKYEGQIKKENETLYDLMIELQNNNINFSFQGKNFPSLGFFVDEINGIKGKPGAYWLYYINNKKAETGITNYILKNGDIINWVQE